LPAKIFFTNPSLVEFATSPMKLKLEQPIGGGTTNSKPPGPIMMMGPISNFEQQSGQIYYTLFLHVNSTAASFT
jgi:hypothetical protein